MSSLILKVVGVILAVWLVMSVIGAILSALKFVFLLTLVAVIVMAAVTMIAKTGKAR